MFAATTGTQAEPDITAPPPLHTVEAHPGWNDGQAEFLEHFLVGGPALLADMASESRNKPSTILTSILTPAVSSSSSSSTRPSRKIA